MLRAAFALLGFKIEELVVPVLTGKAALAIRIWRFLGTDGGRVAVVDLLVVLFDAL